MDTPDNNNPTQNQPVEDLPRPPEPGVTPIKVEDEMQNSFLDYSMSVIVGRALPDARDGMKPVHRRCIYGMGETHNVHNQPYKKSARVVGEVMGKYHPHGDSSIYETIVRMAQPFSMRYMLVDGHGNFGSVDGDGAAAMRYTEVRMQRFAEEMLEDLDKDTVDMVSNYDETLMEPTVLPARLPNLLLNGSMGIAVGMATNIPTHNLNELCDAIKAMVDDPAITIAGLMQYVKGPDFPTGGIICGTTPIKNMYYTGRGSIVVRGRAEIEETEKRSRIIITEIPYGVNKADMLQKMGQLVHDKVIDGISEIRDVSKADIRIEIDLKQDAIPQIVLNLLYKNTALQSTFGANMLALDHGRPKVMNLKQLLRCFIDHRIEVITRRTRYLLRKAKERAHLLEGFRIAIDNIDEIVHIIRSSKDDAEAKARMHDSFGLDDIQAAAILEMRLKQLTGLQREKIENEYKEVLANIERYTFILQNPSEVLKIIKQDCDDLKEKYGDARRTDITATAGDVDLKDIIPNEPCVITLSNRGYIKRSGLTAFNEQKRGGKGRRGAKLKEADFVERVYTTMSHNSLLFFTSWGRVFKVERAWAIPEAELNSFGKPVVNIVQLRPEIFPDTKDPATGNIIPPRPAEKVLDIISLGNSDEADTTDSEEPVNEKEVLFSENQAILFVTAKGVVKKTRLSDYKNVNRNGIIAIKIDDDDELVSVNLVEKGDEIILCSSNGQAVHFKEEDARLMGRYSHGVRGMRLSEDDESDRVVAAVKVEKEPDSRLMLMVENGFGTINTFDSYPIHRRGGKGVRSINTGDRNGKVVFAAAVHVGASAEGETPELPADSIIVITAKGQIIRTNIGNGTVRETARGAKGVRIVNVADGDAVVSAAVVSGDEEAEEEVPEEDATASTSPESPAE